MLRNDATSTGLSFLLFVLANGRDQNLAKLAPTTCTEFPLRIGETLLAAFGLAAHETRLLQLCLKDLKAMTLLAVGDQG